MMGEDNQCSLDGLDEEFRMLNTNGQLPPGGYERKKMESDGGERSSNASFDKYKLTIECLPAEVLAICLSYTGEDLPNTRLTCRRFNQVIEDYQYMMNVVPVDKLSIINNRSQAFLAIEEMGPRFCCRMTMFCKLDELMQYVRFLRPQWLALDIGDGKHLETSDMKKYLTDSWRKGIVKLVLHSGLLSVFPNVSELQFNCSGPSDLSLLLAQISAHPSPIRRFTLNPNESYDCGENDLILDVLSKNTNKLNGLWKRLSDS